VLDHAQDAGLGTVEQIRVKKSHARIASAWDRRTVARQARIGAGSDVAFFRISHAVDGATFTPRLASSPWILR
jgi:hypothetical protein